MWISLHQGPYNQPSGCKANGGESWEAFSEFSISTPSQRNSRPQDSNTPRLNSGTTTARRYSNPPQPTSHAQPQSQSHRRANSGNGLVGGTPNSPNLLPLTQSRFNRSPAAPYEITSAQFDCAICQESHSVEDIAQVDICQHKFCRECMTDYVRSRLTGDRRYPIPCPNCLAATGSAGSSAVVIDDWLIQMLPITPAEYDTFEQMSLAAHGDRLECPRCHETAHIEHSENPIIDCPVYPCTAVWCRRCRAIVADDRRRHTCDGQAEMDDLARRLGWKQCPVCRTRVERSEGCNHMTCIAPACNSHFCYRCGGLIARNVDGLGLHAALDRHYPRHCTGGMMD
ncbi:hypothetical protein C8R43DRAFT_1186848 [Mycena crocata]|nr:hypothetical protein C8R43DRAFT_1186848 [Mycena crocata]